VTLSEQGRENVREVQRLYRLAFPERYSAHNKSPKGRARHARYRANNHETVIARTKAWHKSPAGKAHQARQNLKNKHGLTIAEFFELVRLHDNRCDICRKEFSKARKPHIDHDHETGQRRGLLCRGCNFAIGLLEDDPELLMAAAKYLTK
jgi:hypothetical protein